MYIVAIAWIFVVLMMSITEHTVVAGVMTFIFYGIVPLSVILYLMDAPKRRLRRRAEEKLRRESMARTTPSTPDEPVDPGAV